MTVKILKIIDESKPLAAEVGSQTTMNSKQIDHILEKKSGKGDQYASRVIRKKIMNFEQKVNDLTA